MSMTVIYVNTLTTFYQGSILNNNFCAENPILCCCAHVGNRIISLVRNNNGACTPHGCMATVVDANGVYVAQKFMGKFLMHTDY